MEIDGQPVHRALELLPHVDVEWLSACMAAINAWCDKPVEFEPVFLNRKHLLAEICVAGAIAYIEDDLTENELSFCNNVHEYMEANPDRKNWDIGHIILE